MADNMPTTGDDELAAEVARLKRELSNLKGAFAERAGDIVQGAGRAADVVVQPIRNHPGAAGMLLGCLIGLVIGLAIGQAATQRSQHWYDRYR